ncbi:MAG: DUF559 domain-containing protein [Candidatus Peregrinibacteria bacterium]
MRSEQRERLYRKRKCEFTKNLRSEMTPEECLLWSVLRDRRSRSLKFRRQVNIGPYVVDFLCKEHSLIVEVDGAIHTRHEQREHDAGRDQYLSEEGYSILRITNDEVRNHLPAVLERIHHLINGTDKHRK